MALTRAFPGKAAIALALILAAVLPPRRASASDLPDPADAHWSDAFGRPGPAGGRVTALAAQGGELYAAGWVIASENGVQMGIARWDHDRWAPIGTVTDTLGVACSGEIYELLVWHGQLIAAGRFTCIDGVTGNNIVRWDGAAWHPLGTGMVRGPGSMSQVSDLAIVGDDLVAAGSFSMAGGVAASGLARWDGASWHAFSDLPTVEIYSLCAWKGGLLAAGWLERPDWSVVRCLELWDGERWSTVEGGPEYFGPNAMTVFGDRVLFATDTYSDSAGCAIQTWDGEDWSPFCPDLKGHVYRILVHEGEVLAAGYISASGFESDVRVARWDGAGWHPVGPPFDGWSIGSILMHDGELIVGGHFDGAGDVWLRGAARWSGSEWLAMPPAAGVFDDVDGIVNSGDRLIVAGGLSRSRYGNALLEWDGLQWLPFAPNPDGWLSALDTYEGNLVAAGSFELPDSTRTGLLEWDGTEWSPLSAGVICYDVRCLAVWNGSLIAGGWFDHIGGVAANSIARWDGTSWSPLGDGLTMGSHPGTVYALAVYKGDLIASGYFFAAGGEFAHNIARWDGSAWHPLGGATVSLAVALAVNGDDLYVGGKSGWAGDEPCQGVARWDGTSWHGLGSGVNGEDWFVYALAIYNGDLVAGGDFESAGGVEARNIARWDGATWLPFGSGVDGTVEHLATFGGALYAGGWIRRAGGKPSLGIAQWTEDPPRRSVIRSVHPNPVRGHVTLEYRLHQAGPVRLELYDVQGRKVLTILDEVQSDGLHTFTWDEEDGPVPLPSGVYFLRLEAVGQVEARKVVRLR